jgi:HK97 family phage major capsid protein
VTDTKAQPTTPKEWEEYLHTTFATPESMAAAVKDGSFIETMKGYTTASNKVMDNLKAEVIEQSSAAVLEMFKRNGNGSGDVVNGRPDVRPTNQRAIDAGVAYNKFAPGVVSENIWSGAGQMLQDIVNKRPGVEALARLKKYDDLTAAYSSNVPSTGGYLIPEEVRSEIMTRALEGAIMRPFAQVVPMPSGKFSWPVTDFTTEVGEVYGGIVMQWLDEGQTFTPTEATFAKIALQSHKLGGLARIPNELIRHISALEAWVRQNMPNAIRHFEDLGFLSGDGVKKPLGALHASNPAMIVVNAESLQPADTFTWINALDMLSRLLPESWENAAWICTPDALKEIYTMALPVGTGGSAMMTPEGGGPTALPRTIAGIPIIWTRKTPAVLGDQGDISLVDRTKYVIGDVSAISFDTSEHSAFTSDQTDFRIIEEVDGQPGMLSALQPQNGGPTLSAFVQVATR